MPSLPRRRRCSITHEEPPLCRCFPFRCRQVPTSTKSPATSIQFRCRHHLTQLPLQFCSPEPSPPLFSSRRCLFPCHRPHAPCRCHRIQISPCSIPHLPSPSTSRRRLNCSSMPASQSPTDHAGVDSRILPPWRITSSTSLSH
ncbi:hypothetical protein M0R45_008817 [Rubus argutus]|uniref:Uncharacterized protein n=1 Tax=Rubus argutus TaxID=59490 RepID=A0AAW1Y1U4_RUBAR